MQNILYKWIVALDKLKVASHNTSVVNILFVIRDYLTHYLKISSVNVPFTKIQGVIESCTDILTTSYWLHVELGKNI
jgi:hypothetical protein